MRPANVSRTTGRFTSCRCRDGPGRAIRSRAQTSEIPIYIASLGPANLRLTGELANGWIGNSFFPATADAFFDPIRDGAHSAGRSLDDVDRVVAVGLEFTSDDPAAIESAGRRHADGYAFTFGAMGSANKNFYNDAFARQGYGDDVAEVQRLWAAGDRDGAAARVPIDIGLGTNLVGPPDVIRARLVDYERSGVTTLRVGVDGSFDQKVAQLETLIDIVHGAGAEIAATPESTTDRQPSTGSAPE